MLSSGKCDLISDSSRLWSTIVSVVSDAGSEVMGGSSVKRRSKGDIENREQRCRISGRRAKSARGIERNGIGEGSGE